MKGHWVLAFLVATMSCSGGTETGNPATLKDFGSSACKTRESDVGQQALLLASDAEGLQCVEWETDGSGGLLVRLLNFPEPCGEAYLGAASLEGSGALALSVYKDSCQVFRCGTCVFDFEFTLSGIDPSRDLPLRIGSAVCASEPTTYGDELTLPLTEQSSGSRCRYLQRSAVEQYGRARGSCGQRNLPCGECNGTDMTSCDAGLRCTDVASGDSRCLAECTTDDDCAGGLTTCRDGVCQSSFEW